MIAEADSQRVESRCGAVSSENFRFHIPLFKTGRAVFPHTLPDKYERSALVEAQIENDSKPDTDCTDWH